MDINEKVLRLNKAANDIRSAMNDIEFVCKGDNDIGTLIWRTNKAVEKMHQLICKTLERTIVQEEFDKIVKNIDEK